MSQDIKIRRGIHYERGSMPSKMLVKNNSGGALVPGDVVITDTTVATGDAITTTTSADDKKIAGVVAEPIATGAWGYIYLPGAGGGAITTLKVNGTTAISIGDELSTYTSAKIAAKAGAGKGGAFAIALEAYSVADSLGVLNVLLHSPSRVDSLASAASLDDGYNNGSTITVDSGAVQLNGSHATNNTLFVNKTAGSGHAIQITNAGTGKDINGTSNTWDITKAGVATFVGMVLGTSNLDMKGNDIILDATGLSRLELGTNNQVGMFLNSVEEYTFTATGLDLQGNNLVLTADALTYLGNGNNAQIDIYVANNYSWIIRQTAIQAKQNGYSINDTNNNEVIGFEGVASATTYLNFKNSNGSYMDLETLGATDVGFRFANDTDRFMLRITPVATATVYLDIANAATGNPVVFSTIGENDRGFTFKSATGLESLELTNTASATNGLKVNAQATGSNVEIGANGTGATANRGITLLDSNGNELWIMNAVASAINEITYTNAATGVNPSLTISSSGAENQGLTIDSIGTGTHALRSGVSATNTILAILSLHHDSSGNAAAGFGTRLDYYLENAASENERHCSIDAVVVTATNGAEDSDLRFMTMNGGVIGESLRLVGADAVLQAQNGAAATPAYSFVNDVDTGMYSASGNILGFAVGGAAQLLFDAASAVKGLQFLVAANANILDGNGNEYLTLTSVGSATTQAEIVNAATGTTGPLIRSKGETNVNLRLGGIGTGQLDIVNGTAGGAAAPDLIIAGDGDTGLFGGTNILAIANAGVETIRTSAVNNVHIGGTAVGGTGAGTKCLYLYNGTSPSGTITNGAALYCATGEIYTIDAAGNTTLQSPHSLDTGEWIFYSKNLVSGKVLRVDMEKLAKALNEKFGWDFVHEFMEPVAA